MTTLIVYLGRSGAGTDLANNLHFAYRALGKPVFSILSSYNEEKLIPKNEMMSILTYRSVIGFVFSLILLPYWVAKISDLCKTMGVEKIVFPMNTPYSVVVQVLLHIIGYKVYPILHDAIRHPGDPYKVVTFFLTFLELRMCRKVIFLNKVVKNSALQIYRIKKEKAISLFLPLPSFELNNDRGIKEYDVLFFGRITTYKGVDILLQANRIMLENGYSIKVGIFGKSNKDLLITEKNVHFENRYLKQNEIYEIIGLSRMLVLPYIEASQSGVAAFAVHAELPIVATPLDSLIEQLEGTGTMFASEVSPEAIAEVVSSVLSDGVLFDDLVKKHKKVKEEMSWEKFVVAFEGLK